jgi:hypothetical protein
VHHGAQDGDKSRQLDGRPAGGRRYRDQKFDKHLWRPSAVAVSECDGREEDVGSYQLLRGKDGVHDGNV